MFTASPSLCQSRLFMFSVKFQGKFLWINTTLRKSKISLVMQNQENWRYMSFLVASVQTSPKGNDRITVGKRREDKWIQQAYFIWLTFSTKDDIFEKTKSASHFILLFLLADGSHSISPLILILLLKSLSSLTTRCTRWIKDKATW